GGKAAAAALGTALVVAGGTGAAVAWRPGAGAAPTAVATTADRPAALVAVRACPFGADPSPAAPRPVRLPRQVRLPEGAAVYEATGTYRGVRLIGPAEADCKADGGSWVGSAVVRTDAGGVEVQLYSRSYVCAYFPDSAQAAELRRTRPTWCTEPGSVRERQDVPTGLPGHEAYLTVEDGRPGAVILRMLALDRASGGPGPGLMITCDLPRSRAEICVAALTHRFVEIMGRAGASAQVLDRAARQIRAYVPSRLR
ncbi:hypothetical protein, partial [Thermomonospora catenispora]|uniref:hypothetical protein n=1 Tax=Thermomonospora catenispora TaxID=2493090 RepID=UPI0019D5440E